jgi:hypothetical protein
MRQYLLVAFGAIPLLTGCAQVASILSAAAPAPLPRFKPQDPQAILQTLERPAPTPQSAADAQEARALLPITAILGAPPTPPRALQALVPPRSGTDTGPALLPVELPAVQPAPVPAAVPSKEEVQEAVEAWRQAWERGDVDRYLRAYHATFKGDLSSREEWERQRQARLANGNIRVAISGLKVSFPRDREASIAFLQHYASGRHADVGEKRLRLRREADGWRIVQEGWAYART